MTLLHGLFAFFAGFARFEPDSVKSPMKAQSKTLYRNSLQTMQPCKATLKRMPRHDCRPVTNGEPDGRDATRQVDARSNISRQAEQGYHHAQARDGGAAC